MGATNHRVIVGAVVVLSVVVALQVHSQQSERGDRVIHRYLDSERWGGEEGESGAEVPTEEIELDRATRPDGAPGESPGLWLSPSSGEWIWTPDGPVGARDVDTPHGAMDNHHAPTRLDGQTDRVDQLDYQSSFQPSVIPFKRGGVQDRVARTETGDYIAELGTPRYERVPVGGAAQQGEERFWGTFLVRLDPGAFHRVASVAPSQRVLSIESEPQIEMEVFRDQADNFYVAAGQGGAMVRINMEVAAPRQYFDGPFDRDVHWEQFEPGVGLDSELQEHATAVVDSIGIDRDEATPVEALERLVEYHRGFESRAMETAEGRDRYIEISERRVGVCRHRSLTFMISARALGFETRYVYNEAHAFVEVNWPGDGWRRIDLGGAADEVQAQNLRSDRIHDGVIDDELPRPENYEEEMAPLQGQLDTDQGDEFGQPQQLGAGQTDDEFEAQPEPTEAAGMGEGPDQPDGRAGRVELLEMDGQVYRGGTVQLEGRVDPVPEDGQAVEVVLLPVGARDFGQGELLGTTEVGDDGHFEAQWEVPEDLSLGRWRVDGRVVHDDASESDPVD